MFKSCRRHLLIIVSFFLTLLFLSFPSSLTASCKLLLNWKTVKTRHFSIHYTDEEETVARKLVPISEEIYENLSKKFGVRPWGRTEVVLLSHHDISKGLTTPVPYNLMMLRVAQPLNDSLLADYDDWLRTLFLHEYTHVVHLKDTSFPAKILKPIFGTLVTPNGLSPTWVTEGLATYFETVGTTRGRGRSSFMDMVLRTDILRDRFLHLDQMAGTQYQWPSAVAPTLYGVGFWQYLSDAYGEEKLIEFSHRLGGSLWFYSLNHQSKKVFRDSDGKGKSFYLLWQEWENFLRKEQEQVKEKLQKEGLEEGETFLSPRKGESFSIPTLSPDGRHLAYLATSIHHPQELRYRDLELGQEKTLLKIKEYEIQQLSISADGERLLLSKVSPFRGLCKYADLYEVDLKTGKVQRLTSGVRARDPDDSPDGKRIVAILQQIDTALLAVYDPESKELEPLLEADQLGQPRWLPDGRSVIVSVHRKGQWDLWIVDTKTKEARRITNDVGIENHLAVNPKNSSVYYSSDKTGISNIYRYDLRTGKNFQITNVLTGAFAPTLSQRETLLFQYYTGDGFELRRLSPQKGSAPLSGEADPTRGSPTGELGFADVGSSEGGVAPSEFKYNPFPRFLLPHFLIPRVALIDGALFASLSTQNFDPLQRHQWYGGATYRNDNKFIGYNAGYAYARFLFPISVGYTDSTVNYGDVFDLGADFFEERKRGFAGITTPPGPHRFTMNYFFEDRTENAGLPAGSTLLTLGHYAGLSAQYALRKTHGTAAQISPEEGTNLSINYEISNSFFGTSQHLEQQVIWGDSRAYIPLPFADHHVLALRAAGGFALGDLFLQGNFGLGGSTGEGPYSGLSSRTFTLRGLPLQAFSRDRAWVASAEYRLPLFRLQRGLGTFPLALNSTHLAFFTDIGDAFDAGEETFRPLLGVGGEFRTDLIIGYKIPITTRLGYGIILTHRERIGGEKDGLTGASAKNGVVVLEIGTSF